MLFRVINAHNLYSAHPWVIRLKCVSEIAPKPTLLHHLSRLLASHVSLPTFSAPFTLQRLSTPYVTHSSGSPSPVSRTFACCTFHAYSQASNRKTHTAKNKTVWCVKSWTHFPSFVHSHLSQPLSLRCYRPRDILRVRFYPVPFVIPLPQLHIQLLPWKSRCASTSLTPSSEEPH